MKPINTKSKVSTKNATQLEEQVYTNVSEEYIKRLSVIWTSNISVPRKTRATNAFALSLLQYHNVDSQLEDQWSERSSQNDERNNATKKCYAQQRSSKESSYTSQET